MRLSSIIPENVDPHGLDELLYHGTTSTFLDTILKQGLVAKPDQRVWQGRLKSFGGAYVATTPGRAWKFSVDAARKFGGAPIIIVTDKNYLDASTDEDLLVEFLFDRHERLFEICGETAERHGIDYHDETKFIEAFQQNEEIQYEVYSGFAEELGWYFQCDGHEIMNDREMRAALEEFADSVVEFGFCDFRILPKDPMLRLMNALGLVEPYYSRDDEDRPGTTARFGEGVRPREIKAIIQPRHEEWDEDEVGKITSISDIPHEVLFYRDRDAPGQMKFWNLHENCIDCGDNDDVREYLHGSCHSFTYAAWLRHGGKMIGMFDMGWLSHSALEMPDGRWIDASGVVTPESLIKRYLSTDCSECEADGFVFCDCEEGTIYANDHDEEGVPCNKCQDNMVKCPACSGSGRELETFQEIKRGTWKAPSGHTVAFTEISEDDLDHWYGLDADDSLDPMVDFHLDRFKHLFECKGCERPAPPVAYHGTSTSAWEKIQRTGLLDPYLARTAELADYYAEGSCDYDTYPRAARKTDVYPVVLEIDLRGLEDSLRYDMLSMDEPICFGCNEETRDAAWDEAERMHPEWVDEESIFIPDNAWWVSWDGVNAMRYDGTIPPERIRVL